jgi:hypothetical protein
MPVTLTFSSPLWRYSAGKWSWYFVTLPREDKDFIKWIEEKTVVGFGFIRVRVTVWISIWETTLFPSKEHDSYLLSINAKVRKKENIREWDTVDVYIELL